MAIIASIFAVIGRFLGRVLTMALGWASILLFGRVPASETVGAAVMGAAAAAVNVLFERTPLARLRPASEAAERDRRERETAASQL